MPNRPPHDPIGAFNFKVEIEGVTTAFVSKVDGLEGGAFSGRAGLPGKVTLHGVAPLDQRGADRIEGWYKASQGGARATHKVSIVKYDSGGREVQRHAIDCWPSEWKVSEMDGKSSNAGVSVRGWDFADKKTIIGEVKLIHTGLRVK